jgi:hypothetical protein
VQVAHQMGHSKIETTKNIYGHLFAQDRALILDAMNQAVSRLYAYGKRGLGRDRGQRCSCLTAEQARSLALSTVGPGTWCF